MAALAESQRGLCSEHPGQPAVGTCDRCGRFVCRGCLLASGICPQCVARAVHALPPGGPRSRWAQLAIGLQVALSTLAVTHRIWFEIQLPRSVDLTLPLPFDPLGKQLDGTNVPLSLLSCGCFLYWLHLMIRTTRALGGSIGFTPAKAMGAWFIPFVNMVWPYQIMGRLQEVLTGEGVETTLVGVWWGSYLLSTLGRMVHLRMRKSVHSLAALAADVNLLILSEAALLVSGVCLLLLIQRIQTAADTRRARVTAV